MIFEKKELRNKMFVFRDREHAGEELAKFLEEKLPIKKDLLVLAVPRGGVPVGCVVAKRLKAMFDLIIVRKIPIPWNTEAGFGSITPDADVVIDYRLMEYLGIDEKTLNELIKHVLEEIKRRNKVLRRGKGEPPITGKNVVIVDDGIAGGYTMTAAIKYVKKRNPKRIFVATPTGCLDSLLKIEKLVDSIFCLNVRIPIPYFAVADAYENWFDLTDEDVIRYLKKYGFWEED